LVSRTEKQRFPFNAVNAYADTDNRAGTFDFGEETQQITFTMLMEDSWLQELARDGIV